MGFLLCWVENSHMHCYLALNLETVPGAHHPPSASNIGRDFDAFATETSIRGIYKPCLSEFSTSFLSNSYTVRTLLFLHSIGLYPTQSLSYSGAGFDLPFYHLQFD